MRIASVQGNTIKCRTQSLGRHAQTHVMETLVGTLRSAFPSKHAGWIFAFALKRINSRRVGELSWYIFLQLPMQQIAPSFVAWRADFWHLGMTQTLGMGGHAQFFVAHFEHIFWRFVQCLNTAPTLYQSPIFWQQFCRYFGQFSFQLRQQFRRCAAFFQLLHRFR